MGARVACSVAGACYKLQAGATFAAAFLSYHPPTAGTHKIAVLPVMTSQMLLLEYCLPCPFALAQA